MMTHYYCSSFSKAYAYKGLLLYNSLLRWDKDFHFFIICLEDEVADLYKQMNLENATIIPISAIERKDSQLLAVKQTRNQKEYAWTAKASAMLYILNKFNETDHIVWLDGDTFFYSDPQPIFDEWDQYSIMLTEERWQKANWGRRLTKGIYNTGFMGFKRDKNALQCLEWFRARLLEWCFDKLENGLWSDQLYVNDWPKRFKNVGVIENLGVNIGPYIIRGCKVTKENNKLFVNGQRLIFYHSYGFRYYDGNEFDLCSYKMSFSDDVIEWIYLPYIHACTEIMKQIAKVDKDFYRTAKPRAQFIRNYFNLQANARNKQCPNICTIMTKDYLIQGLALYYSLKRTTPKFHLWVLCVDGAAYTLLEKMNLANLTLVSLANIKNEKLAKIENSRQIHEFCWTLKASFVIYLIKNHYDMDSILYLDADLFFFKDIKDIYKDWNGNSVFITKLWLGPKWAERVGKYSAGLIGFKRDRVGMKCLKSWRRNCLKWCFDKNEKGLWADQSYLDAWPRLFPEVKISENKGINCGPWNIRKGQNLHVKADTLYFDSVPLICYHFSGFEVINDQEFELCNRKRLPGKADDIYAVYVQEIRNIIVRIKAIDINFFSSLYKDKKKSNFFNHHIIGAGPGSKSND